MLNRRESTQQQHAGTRTIPGEAHPSAQHPAPNAQLALEDRHLQPAARQAGRSGKACGTRPHNRDVRVHVLHHDLGLRLNNRTAHHNLIQRLPSSFVGHNRWIWGACEGKKAKQEPEGNEAIRQREKKGKVTLI